MPVIQYLLERWGFVKLDRYGLVRTPEGRILSVRPAVLDDGAGGRVVGWQEGDPAEAELSIWPAAVRPAPQRAMVAQAAPVDGSVMTGASVAAQVPIAASEAVMPVAVAPEPRVDEDDWEWTIALARARVAAEEVETAAVVGPPPTPSPPRTRPMAVVAVKELPATTLPAAPSTVIPVPPLPTVQDSVRPGRLEPIVRTSPTPDPPASPARFAQGTGSVDRPATSRIKPTTHEAKSRGVGASPAGSMSEAKSRGVGTSSVGSSVGSMSDDTVPDLSIDLSIGDRTKPGVALPPAARAVQLPSVKRRMAQQAPKPVHEAHPEDPVRAVQLASVKRRISRQG